MWRSTIGNISVKADEVKIKNSEREKLLGVKVDLQLNFYIVM